MLRILSLICLIVIVAVACQSGDRVTKEQEAAIRQEITRLLEERAEEVIARSQLGRRYAPRVVAEPNSIVDAWYPLADSLIEDRRAYHSITSLQWIDPNIQVLASNVAHVTTRWEMSATSHEGEPEARTGILIGVWLERGGDWYQIAGPGAR